MLKYFDLLNATKKAHAKRHWVNLLRNRINHVFELVKHELEGVFKFIEPEIGVVLCDLIDMVLQHDKVLFDLNETIELVHQDRVHSIASVIYSQEIQSH